MRQKLLRCQRCGIVVYLIPRGDGRPETCLKTMLAETDETGRWIRPPQNCGGRLQPVRKHFKAVMAAYLLGGPEAARAVLDSQ